MKKPSIDERSPVERTRLEDRREEERCRLRLDASGNPVRWTVHMRVVEIIEVRVTASSKREATLAAEHGEFQFLRTIDRSNRQAVACCEENGQKVSHPCP